VVAQQLLALAVLYARGCKVGTVLISHFWMTMCLAGSFIIEGMSVRGRLWRFLKTEMNSRLGKFGTSQRKPYQWTRESHEDTKSTSDSKDAKLASYYRMLELPYGAPLFNVKASYKRLMKKYHPDKYQSDEQRETATELVKKLNEAYAELTKHLEATAQT
jgi:DnaJ domain